MADPSAVASPRRYYLLKRLEAARLCLPHLAGVWRSKQEALAATALPLTFPLRTQLSAAGYSAVDDLDGVTVDELLLYLPDLSPGDAQAIVSAAAAL